MRVPEGDSDLDHRCLACLQPFAECVCDAPRIAEAEVEYREEKDRW